MKLFKKIIYLILFLLFFFCISIFFKTNKIYYLEYPTDIKTISIEYRGIVKEITDLYNIKSINNLFKNKETRIQSINDNPIVNDYYIITVNDNFMIYIYSSKNKFFIERPYNGIYKITKEEYENIISLLN